MLLEFQSSSVRSPMSGLVVPEVVPILPLLAGHAVEEIVAIPEMCINKKKEEIP